MAKLINKTLLLSNIDNLKKETINNIKDIFKEEDIEWEDYYLQIGKMDRVSFWNQNNSENYNFEMGRISIINKLKEML